MYHVSSRIRRVSVAAVLAVMMGLPGNVIAQSIPARLDALSADHSALSGDHQTLGNEHTGLAGDHQNLGIDHTGLDQKLDQVLAEISNLMVGAPCGLGTEGERFVVNGPEVCDNTTGLYWEQSPSTSVFNWQGAKTIVRI